jgi:hypothetical protein
MQRNVKPAHFAPDLKQNSAARSSGIFHDYYGAKRGTYSLPRYQPWRPQSSYRYQHPHPSSLSPTPSSTPSLSREQSLVSPTEPRDKDQVAADYEAEESKPQPNVQKRSPGLLLLISNFEALDAASLESSHCKMQIGKKRLVDYFGGARKVKKEHKDDKLLKSVKEPDRQPLPSVHTSLVVNRRRKAVRIGRKKEKDEVVSVEKQEKQNSGMREFKVQERIKFFDGGADLHLTNDGKIRRASTIAHFARNGSNSMSSSVLPGRHLTTLQSCPNLRSIHAAVQAPLPQTPMRDENIIKESGSGKERGIIIDNTYSIDRVHTRGRTCERLVQPHLSPPSRIPKPSPRNQCGSNEDQPKRGISEKNEQLYAKVQRDPERESELVLKKRVPVAAGSAGAQIAKPVSLEISSPTKQASGIDSMAATGKESRQAKDHSTTRQRQASKIQEKIRLFSHPNVAAVPTRPNPISIPVRKHRLILNDTKPQTVSAIKRPSDAGSRNDPLPPSSPEETLLGREAILVSNPVSTPSHSLPKPQRPPALVTSKPKSKGDIKTQSASQGRMLRISDRIKLFEGFTTAHRGYGKLDLLQPSKDKNEKDSALEKDITTEAKPLCSSIPRKAGASNDADARSTLEGVSQPKMPLRPSMKLGTELAMPTLAGEIELEAAISAALSDLEAPTIAAAAVAGKGSSLRKDALSLRSQQERSQRRDRRSRSRSGSRGGDVASDGCDGAMDQKTPVGEMAAKTGDSARTEKEKWKRKKKGKRNEEERRVGAMQAEVCLDYQCSELGKNRDVAPIAPDMVREIWFRSSVSGGENGSGDLDRGYENEAVLVDTVVAQCELSAPRPRRLTEAVRMVRLCRGWNSGEWKGDREKSGSWGKRMGVISALAGSGGGKEVVLLH